MAALTIRLMVPVRISRRELKMPQNEIFGSVEENLSGFMALMPFVFTKNLDLKQSLSCPFPILVGYTHIVFD